jgi:hypothetical protein
LVLVRYGWGEAQRDLAQPRSVTAAGGHVAYAWEDALTEWYVNDRRGLEHGYTVHARPVEASGPLVLALAIRGGLVPALSADGRDVRFVDTSGRELLTYTGLAVIDAERKALAAGWQWSEGELRLKVDDHGARYPLTIDPIVQVAYLKASNAEFQDNFGGSVSVSGDTLVVGAHGEDSNATGVNGDESNNSAATSGAAYVFVRNGTTWSQQAYLKASNTEAFDNFGISVSISGDTIVVGAPAEDSSATGVNGNQGDNSAPGAGAAYVFVRSGTTWSQQAYLKASNTGLQDRFGETVSVQGNTIVVGAYLEDSNARGVNGNQSNDLATDSGAAYVFLRSGTTWSQQAYLKASNTGANDFFGLSVAVNGQTIVVAAEGEDSNATGVNGDQSNNTFISSGAAYVFVRSGTTWSQEAYLKASNTDAADHFGGRGPETHGPSVAVNGTTIVVGAWGEDSNATGVNGNQSDNSAANSGAAYVFVRNGTTWSQQAYLKASNTERIDQFGVSVSVSFDTAVVGADTEDGDNNLRVDSGAAYVFTRNGATWSQQAYLKAASNANDGDLFGGSVSVSGTGTVVVGARLEDSPVDSGAAYVFCTHMHGSFVPFGTGCVGSNGLVPRHFSNSTGDAGTTSVYEVADVQPNSAMALYLGFSNTLWNGIPLPLSLGFIGMDPSCNLLVEPFFIAPFSSNSTGRGSKSLAVPIWFPIGTKVYTQVHCVDFGVSSPLKVTVSGGLLETTGGDICN